MSTQKTYTDGYIDAYQSVRGKGVVPSIPAHAIPAGKTLYQAGHDDGREAATR